MPKMKQTIPLRQRKKNLIKEAISASARELLSQRPFADVTVAEIADHANVSVKTLFTYFRSKDDLLFFEESTFCEKILQALRNRKEGVSYLEEMQSFLWQMIHTLNNESILDSFPGFHRAMESAELNSRLSKLWDHYEKLLADMITEEGEFENYDPEPKIIAALLILPFRQLTTSEYKIDLERMSPARRLSSLEKWHSRTQSLISDGIRNLGKKER